MPTPIYRAGAQGQRWACGEDGSQCGGFYGPAPGGRGDHDAIGHRSPVTALLLRADVCAPARSTQPPRITNVACARDVFISAARDDTTRGEVFLRRGQKMRTPFRRDSSTQIYSWSRRRRHGPETPSSTLLCSDLSPAPLKHPLLPPEPAGPAMGYSRARRGLSPECSHLATVRCQPVFTPSARPRYQVTVARSPASSAI